MSHPECEDCQLRSCWFIEKCSSCVGTGFFIGAGIESIHSPHFYTMFHPSKLPCPTCEGHGWSIPVRCPFYEEDDNSENDEPNEDYE